MRKRHESKPIQGWGWLGDAAEEAAVQRMAPARPSNAIKAKQKPGAGRARVPAKGGGKQLTDDDYRQLAQQQDESEGKVEIDPHGKVSRSETGAWVEAWVFIGKPGRG
jgi:hypothetical protein